VLIGWSHLAERFTVSTGGFDKLSRNSEKPDEGQEN